MPNKKSSKKETESISQSKIGDLVRKMETDFTSGTGVVISKYVRVDMYEDLNRIDAYLNSKHITGETDSLGREKPFFNIVTAAVNIWYRATVIKLNKIRLRATKSKDTIDSFLANVHLQDWFRRERFGVFLSEWGRALAQYGSSVTKFVEKDGKLIPMVVSWNRMIVDPVDFENNPKIEILELTEAQLYQREGYDKDMIEKLCNALQARETTDKTKIDTKNNYIKLYEVHGNLPLSDLTGKEDDEDTYVEQMHVISFVASKEAGKFDDFTLVSGREDDPYLLTHLIKEDGQVLSWGAVRNLFEAQWMVNHSEKSIKDQLDLASKILFQTSDGNYVGMNALTDIENGDILIHAPNQGLSQLNNSPVNVAQYQAFKSEWKALANEINGISESMMGITAPSGTAWRQVETLLQENHSLFETMRDNKGLSIEEMARRFIIPHLKKQMDTTKEVSATLEEHDIEMVDSMFMKNQATLKTNQAIIESILRDEIPTPQDQQAMMGQVARDVKDNLMRQGNQRFFSPSEEDDSTWKEQFKDLEWELEVDSKDDPANNDAVTTLNTLLKTIVGLQGRPLTQDEKFLVNKILNLVGTVNPLQLKTLSGENTPPASPVQPPQQTPTEVPNAPQPVT